MQCLLGTCFIDDVNCNLFSIIDIDELPSYKTELNELFSLLRIRNDNEEIHKLLLDNKRYANIGKETAIMMREFTNIKLPRKNKEGKYNMCKGIMELEQKNQKVGADNAFVKSIKSLMKNTQKSYEEACSILEIKESDMLRYKKMI